MIVENEATSVFIEILERTLVRARAGELRGLAVVAETEKGSRCLWASEMPTTLGAAVYSLSHTLMTSGFEERENDSDDDEELVETGRN